MNYIVMDLEWNQSSKEEDTVKEIPFEVIEIGAIKLNNDRIMVGEFNELIKPTVYEQMHQITSKLIHLQMKELQSGKNFIEVMEQFRQFCGDDYIFCTWGPLDLIELQRNIRFYKMEPLSNGPIKYLDVQKLFSIAFEDQKTRRTLEYAIDYLEIEKDIPFHRAFSDAYYTSKVLACLNEKILRNVSFDNFHLPKNKEEEIHIVFDTYEKYISRKFEDRLSAMEDREVSSTRCYICKKNNKKKIKWFSYNNGKHYLSVSYCEKHGYMKGKIRLKKAEDGGIYVIKTTKLIPVEMVQEIVAKQKKLKANKNKPN